MSSVNFESKIHSMTAKNLTRTLILDIPKYVSDKVKIEGWVATRRDHGKLVFIDLADRSGVVQVVGDEKLSSLRPQFAVEIIGVVKKRPASMINKKIATGEVEVTVENFNILAKSKELPFDMGGEDLNLELPTLFDYRSLTLRYPKVKNIFKIQSYLMDGFRKAAQDLDCTEVFVPTISASSTEGGAEVFKLDYYGHEAFMIQSPQLYKQILVGVFERVFAISHAYRAEPSVTTRHLSESIQMDCEFGFVDFEQLLDYLEEVGKKTLKHVEEVGGDILYSFGVPKLKLPTRVPRLRLGEAQKIIKELTGVDHTKESDLDPQDEREISKWALKEYNSDLVTITHFPTKKRAFYTMPDPDDPEYSLSYDLLFRGMEILSGSQRINDYKALLAALKQNKLDPKNFEIYLQSFAYGMPPEGGFSFGLERMTMQLLRLANIREASLFPRDMERVDVRLTKIKKSKTAKK